jgi:hypothetical protein
MYSLKREAILQTVSRGFHIPVLAREFMKSAPARP